MTAADEPSFLIKLVLEKLDRIDMKLDGTSEKLVSHEIRLSNVEQRLAHSWKTRSAVGVALVSAVLSWVLPLVTK